MASFMSGFRAFFPEYLAAHRDPRTRAVHYVGTALGVLLALSFFWSGSWAVLAGAAIVGYGPAMASHPIIEGNIPKTFEHPVWSFMSDFRMLYLFLTGGLAAELARLPPPDQAAPRSASMRS